MPVIAKYCPEIKVTIVDRDEERINAWNSEHLPIYEPLLKELIDQVRGVNLFFSTEVDKAIRESQVIFIAVNTPNKTYGMGQNGGYDLSAYESVARQVAATAEDDKIIVEKSTVPVRTADKIRRIFEANRKHKDINFEVVSNPEFLAEGTAIKNNDKPDRVLVGGMDSEKGKKAVEILASIYGHWVPRERIITTGLFSAELSKLACNAFLAQRISSINSISAICEASGADITEVQRVLGSDHRIGPDFLNASVGFGGSCFAKDLQGLVYLCESMQLHPVAEYWKQVLIINNYQKQRFAMRIVREMFDTVYRKKICVFGFAFKKNTGDVRDSAAIDICQFLLNEGAQVSVYDPKVLANDVHRLFEKVVCERDPYDAAQQAHAIVIATEWDEFKTLDWSNIFACMKKPAFIFDGRNILDHEELRSIGFQVFAVGRSIRNDVSYS